MEWLSRLVGPAVPRHLRIARSVALGLLVGACAYRIWLVFTFNPMDALSSDPGRHWTFGTRPLDTQPLAAIDPFGYHVYIAVLAKITAGSQILIAYWTALLSLAGPWLWYRFFRELLPSRDWALAGWLVLAALPSWSAIYSYFMQETLMLPLLGAALWATWRCRRKQDTGSFVVAAAVWMLAGLTRGICIPLAAVAMSWLWLVQEDKLRKAGYSMILLVAVLAPLAGRSWYMVRQISPHGVAAMNMLYAKSGAASFSIDFTRQGGAGHWPIRFMSPAVLRPPFEPLSDWDTRRLGHVHFEIDLDAGRRDWIAARDSLPPWTPASLATLTADNLILLFFSESWPDTNRERQIGRANYWLRWIWAPLTLLCLIWAVAARARERERLLPALLLTWILFQGLVPLAVNEGRYRKPFEGLLVAQCLLLASASAKRRNAGDSAALRNA
jgi:hypothetical protein